jgi:hypothetical protein
MPDKGLRRAFDNLIPPLPNGGELHTLRDAINFIAGLPSTSMTRGDRGVDALVAEHGG